MSKVSKLTVKPDCDEQAGLWIARIDRGLSQAEKDELGHWLSAKQANYKAFLETAELWDQMEAIAMLSEICPESSKRKTGRVRYALPIAASVLVSIAAALWYWAGNEAPTISDENGESAQASMNYATAIGEQRSFQLPDGSGLVLNTNSLVTVNFTETNRLLVLERGEIHIVVAHDIDRVFSVLVGDRVVQAVGTEFNIEITSDQSIELVVTEGLVVVGILEKPLQELRADELVELAQSSTLVAAGQEAIIRHVDRPIQQIEAAEIGIEEIAVKLSWRNGNLVFRGETLEEALAEIGRYTAVEFVFMDEESKKERVAGRFKAGDVDALLAALRDHFEISYEWVGDDKVVLNRQ